MSGARAQLQAQIASARERFLALQVRERWMLGGGAVAVVLTLFYLAVWEPLAGAHASRTRALADARALAVQLEEVAQKVQQAQRGNGGGRNAGRNLSLMAAVDQASQQNGPGKAPARIQPEGDKEVRVWFEDLSFDALVVWLAQLDARYGIQVRTMDVEAQTEAGHVNVRLSLVRGA